MKLVIADQILAKFSRIYVGAVLFSCSVMIAGCQPPPAGYAQPPPPVTNQTQSLDRMADALETMVENQNQCHCPNEK